MSTGQLTAHSGGQPGSSRAGPRDSAALRQELAARAPLLSCERLLFSDNPMTIASIATGHCPASINITDSWGEIHYAAKVVDGKSVLVPKTCAWMLRPSIYRDNDIFKDLSLIHI